ncbi:MAG: hypothetical protein R3346_01490 [Candidatus Spechtbacterales bacterium]|nr:hypothetical protein [Candidatus Spechtbacterales bacterium]
MGFFKKTPLDKNKTSQNTLGKSDILMCPECSAVYYYKSWHHNLREYKELTDDKNVEFKLCPADIMKKHGLFEGLVSIENFPKHLKDEIINQIHNITDHAFNRDPMDRLLELHVTDNRAEVKTSENQLALSVARQVHKAHKNTELSTKLSKGDSVARARVWWPRGEE